MKEKYIKPETNIEEFKFNDVIITSKIGVTPSGWIDKWY